MSLAENVEILSTFLQNAECAGGQFSKFALDVKSKHFLKFIIAFLSELEYQYLKMTKLYQKILVPFDTSKFSSKALQEASEIAKKFNSKIFLITVLESDTSRQEGLLFAYVKGMATRMEVEDYASQMYQHADGLLQRVAYEYEKKDIHIEHSTISGSPKKSILEFAKKKNVDLIVMGTQGLGGIEKFKVLGSVSRWVSENATCPVMLVH